METSQKKLIAFIGALIALIAGIVIFTKPLANPQPNEIEPEIEIENT